MAAATIDRYLAPVKQRGPIRGKTAKEPGDPLRNSITLRKAGDEVETEPGFFEVDTVAHCGPSLKGESCRSVNFTDVHTGRVFTAAIRNNAHAHIRAASDSLVEQVPFAVKSPASTAAMAPSSPTTPWPAGPTPVTCSSPRPGPTRGTTLAESSPQDAPINAPPPGEWPVPGPGKASRPAPADAREQPVGGSRAGQLRQSTKVDDCPQDIGVPAGVHHHWVS